MGREGFGIGRRQEREGGREMYTYGAVAGGGDCGHGDGGVGRVAGGVAIAGGGGASGCGAPSRGGGGFLRFGAPGRGGGAPVASGSFAWVRQGIGDATEDE